VTAESQPLVSIVIRNRNEAEHLRKVLKALSVQAGPSSEVIVVDNGSRDESIAVAEGYGATIVHLPERAFTYGRALNAGLSAARGEVCVILSAHSLPLGNTFISSCLAPFSDPKIAAVRCVYVGKHSDSMRWTAPECLDALSSLQDVISKGPLASGCAIRRSVWVEVPFDEHVVAAEDKLWTAKVLRRGYIVLSPCPAFYMYLKVLTPANLLRKNDLELRAVFSATGEKVGAAKVPRRIAIWRAAVSIAVGAPLAAWSVINRELTRVSLRVSFPTNDARGDPRQGELDNGARSSTDRAVSSVQKQKAFVG
jgi:rhamnosyltransferase